MEVMDGYVRVSRKMGREGDSYMSPSIQEDDIRRWAEDHGVAVDRLEKDENVSGGKAVADRKLGALVDRIESGASAGVIVNHTDRFGRDELDAAIAIKRIHDAGGRMIATQQGLDSSRAESKMVVKFYLMMAKQHWDNTKRRNVEERGLHVCAKPPFGYRRKDEVEPTYEEGELVRNAKLVVHDAEAEAVVMVFQLRARGETWANIVRRLEAKLGHDVSPNMPRRILDKRAYLGEASAVVKDRSRPGERTERIAKKGAHAAIVTQDLWDAAHAMDDPRTPNDGTLAAQALLAGVVRCASCGEKMHIRGRGPKGKRRAFYSCARKKRAGQPPCAAPANADVKVVDDHVVWVLSQDESGALDAAGSEEQHYLEAREAVRAAEDELAHWMENPDGVSAEVRRSAIAQADQDVAAARAALWGLDDPGVGEATVAVLGGKLWATTAWGDDPAADRLTLRRYVGSVTVTWADGSAPKIASTEELLSASASTAS